jgi:hypothetical protein
MVTNPHRQTHGRALDVDPDRVMHNIFALNRLAAEDPAVHKLTDEVQKLLRPRSVYRDPALVQRVLAKMAEA